MENGSVVNLRAITGHCLTSGVELALELMAGDCCVGLRNLPGTFSHSPQRLLTFGLSY